MCILRDILVNYYIYIYDIYVGLILYMYRYIGLILYMYIYVGVNLVCSWIFVLVMMKNGGMN